MLIVVVLVLVFLVLAAFALAAKARQAPRKEAPWPFYAKKPLSAPEQVLYFRLCKALPDHIVLAQVGLSRLLGVRKGHDFNEWFNRINRMSADFVVCAKDASILAVIELDDATHAKADRQAADAKKDKALTAAGIRILRWQAKALPDEGAILKALAMPAQDTTVPPAS